MRLTSLVIAVPLLVVALTCQVGRAGQIKIQDAPGGLNGWEGSGGAFSINHLAGNNGQMGGPGGSATSFSTFCIERNEFINFGNNYYTAIDTGAKNGGYSGATAGIDPISSATALLYSTFRNNLSIAGLPIIGTATTTANRKLTSSLQYAIWRLEGEVKSDGTYSLNPDNSASGLNLDATVVANANIMYNWANANASGGLYGVRVLQMYSNPNFTGNAQDQLTLAPSPTASIGGAVLLGVLGIVARMKRGAQSAQVG